MTAARTTDNRNEPRWRMEPPAGCDVEGNVPRRCNPAGPSNGYRYWSCSPSRSGVSQGERLLAGTASVVSSDVRAVGHDAVRFGSSPPAVPAAWASVVTSVAPAGVQLGVVQELAR